MKRVHGAIEAPGEPAGKRSGCSLLTGDLVSHGHTVLLEVGLGGTTYGWRLAGHVIAAFLDDLNQAFEFAPWQACVDWQVDRLVNVIRALACRVGMLMV